MTINNYFEVINNPRVKRVIIFGDIHGQYDLFMKALKKLNFNEKEDLIICTGDLVDHGDKNLEVIELLNQPWFKSVRGNHDQMCMDGLSNTKIKQAHKLDDNGGAWFYDLSDEQQEKVFEAFSQLPFLIEVDFEDMNFGIVHGDIHLNNWESFKDLFLEQDTDVLQRIQNTMINNRDRIEKYDSKKHKTVSEIDYVFLGHTIVDKTTKLDNCIYLDTGAYKTGDFSCAIFDYQGMTLKTIKGKKPA